LKNAVPAATTRHLKGPAEWMPEAGIQPEWYDSRPLRFRVWAHARTVEVVALWHGGEITHYATTITD
jgi:hypothetical protein